MNYVEYESVGIAEFTSKKEGKTQRAKRDQVACRVAEVLDFELARGAMPT
jgi:hypothetical protein